MRNYDFTIGDNWRNYAQSIPKANIKFSKKTCYFVSYCLYTVFSLEPYTNLPVGEEIPKLQSAVPLFAGWSLAVWIVGCTAIAIM